MNDLLWPYSYPFEVFAYRRLKAADCPNVPYFIGSSKEFPPECDIPSEWRLTGKQQGIMLEYVEGEILTESNFRPELQQRVLDAYDALLDASVIHGDSSGSCTFEM